jgi:hypothetical protein
MLLIQCLPYTIYFLAHLMSTMNMDKNEHKYIEKTYVQHYQQLESTASLNLLQYFLVQLQRRRFVHKNSTRSVLDPRV